jgi:hypothetical protein
MDPPVKSRFTILEVMHDLHFMILVRPTICHQVRFFDGTMNYRPSLNSPGDQFQRADEISLQSALTQLRFGWPPLQGQQLEQT